MASLVKSISLNFRRRRALRKGGKDDTLEHAAHPVVGSPDEVLSPRALDHIDEATGKFQNLFNGRQNIWQRWEETDSADLSLVSEDHDEEDDEHGQATYLAECDRLGVAPAGNITASLASDTVDAKSYGLGVRGLEPLVHALKFNISVTALDLSDNALNYSALFNLGQLLGRSQTIRSLDLSFNSLGKAPMAPKAFAALLPPTARHLRTLRVSNCKLSDTDATALFRSLATLDVPLERIDVSQNAITDKTCSVLGRLLGDSRLRIGVLVLARNALLDRGVAAVAGGLVKGGGASIEKLDVSATGIREGGAEALGTMLERVPGLQRLSVGGNALTEDAIVQLSRGASVAASLIALECDGCPLGDWGARTMLEAARKNAGLARLTMKDCALSEELEAEWRTLCRRRGGYRPGD